MVFGVDQREAMAECVDLINSGRSSSGEQLPTLADLVAFGRRHRVENLGAARPEDLPRLHSLRSVLDSIASACAARDEATAISGLNRLLAETGAEPQIVSHDGRGPHIHVSRASAPLADRIVAHCAMGLAELVVAGQASRLRSCASPGCRIVFIDFSRNQSRRYCDSRTCGNRLHVAAYRARRSESAPNSGTSPGRPDTNVT
jgi:predicted RNA-binding Zn ribbon-like protein